MCFIFIAADSHLNVEMERPEWMEDSLQNVENLRPLTPTGYMVDSDPDLMIRSKSTSPALEEVERPKTPGRGIVAENESEESADELPSLSPTCTELILVLSDPSASSHQDRPETPGREDKSGWVFCNSGRAPATPGREMSMSESSIVMWPAISSPAAETCLLSNPYVTAPKTPGSDIIFPWRSTVHKRKAQVEISSQPLSCDSHRGSPMSMPSPGSLSELPSVSLDGRGAWISSGLRMTPLLGLENMRGLFNDDGQRETKKLLPMRKRVRRLKRRWRSHQRQRSLKRITGSFCSNSHHYRQLSIHEERKILHQVWKEGLDEEDARLLQCAFDRLKVQDNGVGLISDTLWTPHPHILLQSFTLNMEQLFSYQ